MFRSFWFLITGIVSAIDAFPAVNHVLAAQWRFFYVHGHRSMKATTHSSVDYIVVRR